MSIRLIAATAVPLLLAAPAFADCNQELQKLEQAIVAAETGATGAPVTEHQQEVMTGEQKKDAETEITGSTGTQTEAISPHQEQVTGARGDESAEKPSQLLADARKMAEAGDEQGCMEKLAEIKGLIGEE